MAYVPNPADPTQPLVTTGAETAAAEFRALKGYIQTQIIDVLNGSGLTLDPGDIIYSARNAKNGCLLAQGGAFSRTTYSALFAVIGTTYGAGDGTTTFNVPDLRARTVFGVDPGNSSGRLNAYGYSAATTGLTGGAQDISIATGNLPAHNHTAASAVTDTGHSHTITDTGHHHAGVIVNLAAGTVLTGGSGYQLTFGNSSDALTGININTATTGIAVATTTSNTGSGTALGVVNPFIILNAFIKY